MTKKTFFAAAAAGGLASALSADSHAQSTVTLYGVIDAGITYVNKVASVQCTTLHCRFARALRQQTYEHDPLLLSLLRGRSVPSRPHSGSLHISGYRTALQCRHRIVLTSPPPVSMT